MKGLERGLQTQLWPGGTENSRGDLGRGGGGGEGKQVLTGQKWSMAGQGVEDGQRLVRNSSRLES